MTRPVAGLADPFAPRFARWLLGYALAALVDDVAALVTPLLATRR